MIYHQGGRAVNPNFLFAWPNARVAIMEPQTLAKQIAQEVSSLICLPFLFLILLERKKERGEKTIRQLVKEQRGLKDRRERYETKRDQAKSIGRKGGGGKEK